MAKLLGLLLGLGIGCLIAWIFQINPSKEYGWFAGFFHGAFIVGNFILSWFSSSEILYKAPLHTTAYSVFWWIGAINMIFWLGVNILMYIVGCILNCIKRS